MDTDTTFPAGPTVQGQEHSRKAYQEILSTLNEYAWWRDFCDLLERGWDWRKAIFIAWAASPSRDRNPPTQEALAVQVLRLNSDRVIRKWVKNLPEIQKEIALMQAAPLLKHRRDIFDALVESATNPDPRNHPDRKLALDMMGDYKPSLDTTVSGETTVHVRTAAELSDDDLAGIAGSGGG